MFLDRAQFEQLCSAVIVGKDMTLKMVIPPPALIKPVRMWTGTLLISYKFIFIQHDKKEYPNYQCAV